MLTFLCSGASGCVIASRLACSSSQPSVLLLEAGGANDSLGNLSGAGRFAIAFSNNSPLNWNYKTAPQAHLHAQEIDYSRGRGLGGSTAINFCGWVVGPRDDYEEWARLVEDESFNWQNARRCLDKIENLDPTIPNENLKKYVDAKVEDGVVALSTKFLKNQTLTAAQDHSSTGSVALTYGESWLHTAGDIFVEAEQAGLPTNKDVNSGDPIGMGMGSVSISKGHRVTSSMAYLSNPPSNMAILSNASVARVLFQDKRAVGVETVDGRNFIANKEVIVSGGALNVGTWFQ
jgi:choline dehydrogenase-like flavoprotein